MSKYQKQVNSFDVKDVNKKKPGKRKFLLLLLLLLGGAAAGIAIPIALSSPEKKDNTKDLGINEEYIRKNGILFFKDLPSGVIVGNKGFFRDVEHETDIRIVVNSDFANVFPGQMVTFSVTWDETIEHVDIIITHRDLKLVTVSDSLLQDNIKYNGVHTEGSVKTENVPFTTNFNDGLAEEVLQAKFTTPSLKNNFLKNGDDIEVIVELIDSYYLSENKKSIVVNGLPPLQITTTQEFIEHLVLPMGTPVNDTITFDSGIIETSLSNMSVTLSTTHSLDNLANGDVISISFVEDSGNYAIADVEYTISGLGKVNLILDPIEIAKQLNFLGDHTQGQITNNTFVVDGITVTFDNFDTKLYNGRTTTLSNLTITSDTRHLNVNAIDVEVSGLDPLNITLTQMDIEHLTSFEGVHTEATMSFTRGKVTPIQYGDININLISSDTLTNLSNGDEIIISVADTAGNFIIADITYTISGIPVRIVIDDLSDFIERFYVDTNKNIQVDWKNTLPDSFKVEYASNLGLGVLDYGIDFTIVAEDGYVYEGDDINLDVDTPIIIDAVKGTVTEAHRIKYYEYLIKNGSIYWESIPDITIIGRRAFSRITTFSGDLIIPESVTEIGDQAFLWTDFTSLTLGDNIKSIGAWAFNESPFTSIDLGNSVQTIGERAFQNISFGGILTLPDSLKTIGSLAFEGASLTNIVWGDNVETIGSEAFSHITTLEEWLILPDSIKTIGSYAFLGTQIMALTLGEGVETIGEGAFQNIKTITGNLIIPDSVISIGVSAFEGLGISHLELGNGLQIIGKDVFMNNISLQGELIVGSSVKQIGVNAFAGAALTKITFLEGVQRIEESAFYGVELKGEMILPDSLTFIGALAFHSNFLSSVEMSETLWNNNRSPVLGTNWHQYLNLYQFATVTHR